MSVGGAEAEPRTLSRGEFLRAISGKIALGAAAFAVGYGVDNLWARLVRGWHLERERYPKLLLGHYRIHHNVVGYAAILAGFLWRPGLMVPFGLGMIVGHRVRDRLFWFVERVR
jgi:hypothetical protein